MKYLLIILRSYAARILQSIFVVVNSILYRSKIIISGDEATEFRVPDPEIRMDSTAFMCKSPLKMIQAIRREPAYVIIVHASLFAYSHSTTIL